MSNFFVFRYIGIIVLVYIYIYIICVCVCVYTPGKIMELVFSNNIHVLSCIFLFFVFVLSFYFYFFFIFFLAGGVFSCK